MLGEPPGAPAESPGAPVWPQNPLKSPHDVLPNVRGSPLDARRTEYDDKPVRDSEPQVGIEVLGTSSVFDQPGLFCDV